MASFLDELAARWSARLTLESEDYLYSRGAADDQIEAVSMGVVSGEFQGTKGDRKRFARWSWGLKRLQGHLAFPLHNQIGDVAGVLVRNMEEKDYSKWTLSAAKSSAYFFGLPAAIQAIWETRTVWVVEGPFDWFPLQRLFPNTLATTTDALTWAQAVFVQRYADKVMFALDMDSAGREGIETSKARIGHRVQSHVVTFPFKDPGEFWERRGERAFVRHFTEAARAA